MNRCPPTNETEANLDKMDKSFGYFSVNVGRMDDRLGTGGHTCRMLFTLESGTLL